MEFHAGKIMGLAVSTDHNVAITIGEDSSTRLWDFINHKEIYSSRWIGKGTSIAWSPRTAHNQGKVILLGFDNGIIRLAFLDAHKFTLLAALKPHDAAVVKMKYSPDGNHLVTVGADNTVFFFDVLDDSNLDPVCITHLSSQVFDVDWHIGSDRILLALQSGEIIEMNRPDKITLDTLHSYEVKLPHKIWKIKMMESQKKKPTEEEEFMMPPKRPGEKAPDEE